MCDRFDWENVYVSPLTMSFTPVSLWDRLHLNPLSILSFSPISTAVCILHTYVLMCIFIESKYSIRRKVHRLFVCICIYLSLLSSRFAKWQATNLCFSDNRLASELPSSLPLRFDSDAPPSWWRGGRAKYEWVALQPGPRGHSATELITEGKLPWNLLPWAAAKRPYS